MLHVLEGGVDKISTAEVRAAAWGEADISQLDYIPLDGAHPNWAEAARKTFAVVEVAALAVYGALAYGISRIFDHARAAGE